MADNTEIIVDLKINANDVAKKVADATSSLKVLKQEQKLVEKAFEDGSISAEDYGKVMAQNKADIEAATRTIKSNTAVLQAANSTFDASTMSLDEQRQAVNTLQKAYAALTPEQVGGREAYKALGDQIKDATDKLKANESAIGDNRRNVGNYTESILEASNKMGGFGKATQSIINPVKNATAGLKVMAATPVIAVLNILVTILVKLAEKFKGNAAAMESLTKVFGAFHGVGVIVDKLIDGIAKGVTWLADKIYDLAESFGLISQEMKESQKISQDELALSKKRREAAEREAQLNLEVAQLKAKANDKDKLTTSQRIKLLEEANAKEEEIFKTQYDIAKQEYELQVRKNAQSESSQADLNKESQLKIALINAETSLFNKQRELNGQLAELRTKERADLAKNTEAMQENTEAKEDNAKADKELEAAERRKAEIRLSVERELADAMVNQIEDETDRKMAAEELAWQRELEQLQKQREELGIAETDAQDEINQLIELKEQEHQDRMQAINDEANVEFRQSLQDRKEQAMANAAAISGAIGGLGNILEQFSEENKGAAVASKAIALGQIAVQTGIALATGVAQSQSVPFPANIAAIASTVGTVLANIASAIKTVKSAKFENGGVVGGTSYRGDKKIVRVNSGEGIYNGTQANNLLYEIANNPARGGLDYELLAATIAAQPAPVMDYTEFKQFGQKVSTYEEIASV